MKLVNKIPCAIFDEFVVKSCARPKMRCHRGRTWDVFTSFKYNDTEVDIYCDTTWGNYGYFTILNKWYKMEIGDVETIDRRADKNYVLKRG